ncbi:MAG: hypothetical protein LBT24_04225 [Tannerella sp.]|nr:hypothetical protein [Tannerella sp.]
MGLFQFNKSYHHNDLLFCPSLPQLTCLLSVWFPCGFTVFAPARTSVSGDTIVSRSPVRKIAGCPLAQTLPTWGFEERDWKEGLESVQY